MRVTSGLSASTCSMGYTSLPFSSQIQKQHRKRCRLVDVAVSIAKALPHLCYEHVSTRPVEEIAPEGFLNVLACVNNPPTEQPESMQGGSCMVSWGIVRSAGKTPGVSFGRTRWLTSTFCTTACKPPRQARPSTPISRWSKCSTRWKLARPASSAPRRGSRCAPYTRSRTPTSMCSPTASSDRSPCPTRTTSCSTRSASRSTSTPRIWCSSTTAPPARAFSRKSPRKAF